MDESDFSKTFEPSLIEEKWYAFWEEKKLFEADPLSNKPPYCIVIPPPNVTGVLHMGHALVNTLQDILIRWKRMLGFEVLWVPGTDHAGIATQAVVERHLLATEKKRRSDYSREEFIGLVWEWKEKHEKRILGQLKKLGCSCDWSRLRFTMDQGCNQAVKAMFKKLFDQKLIYRGDYLVNWDPVTQTALADDEVEYEERASFLWYFKYPLTDGSGHITIATTRPETMLGDVAIAISPKDKRHLHLHHKKVLLPFLNRELPIIFDNFVDPEFGSGIVKLTPAHDFNDYQISFHHKLPLINIFTPTAHINENGGPFQGLSREEARVKIVEQMKQLGLLEKVEPYTLRVGLSYRSKAVIEPYLSKQWFVNMAPFIEPLKKLVEEDRVTLHPPLWKNTYFHWVNNLRNWCISRQLWWGHRIPVWHHKEDLERMICYVGEGTPPEVAKEPHLWEQDNDVLDTWFSSSLWPFSTLGWPEKTPELAKFYPNSTLVTGHDILFFWVARMLLMGEYALEKPPFPEVFLHGLIYGKSYWRTTVDGGVAYLSGDEKKKLDLGGPLAPDMHSKWEKLSKSKGNVIDPLEMISEYGTDALRMTLSSIANQTPQIDLDRRRFEEFKNFANKIWNGARFVFLNIEELQAEELSDGINEDLLALEDRWILSRLNRINQEVNTALTNYHFDQAAQSSYDFFWKEFCAYYVEIAKPVLFGKSGSPEERKNKQKILVIVLSNALRLLHPMAPFITEELFQKLKAHFSHLSIKNRIDPYTRITLEALSTTSISQAPYPQVVRNEDIDPTREKAFALMEEIVYTVRNIRGQMRVPPHLPLDLYIVGNNPLVAENQKILSALLKIGKLEITPTAPSLSFTAQGTVADLTLILPLPAEMAEKEKERTEKERVRLLQKVVTLKAQLSDENFTSRAKPEVIEKQKAALAQAESELAKL